MARARGAREHRLRVSTPPAHPSRVGESRVKDASGLLSTGGVRQQIQRELIEGSATQELHIEGFDPLEAPDKSTVRVLARGASPGEVTVTDGARVETKDQAHGSNDGS